MSPEDLIQDPAENASEFEELVIPPKRPLEEEIIARASASHEPMPMLDVILSRMSTSFGTMMKSENGLLVEASVPKISYMPWGQAIAGIDPNGLTGMARSTWGGSIGIGFDSNFTHSAIQMMLGGSGHSVEIPKRAPTALERSFVDRLCQQSLTELSAHFSRITEVKFTLDSLESQGQLGAIFAATAMTAHCEMELTIAGRQGMMVLLLPMQTLEPVSEQLSKMFLGEKLGSDQSWRDHFANQISGSQVPLLVELHQLKVNLAEILAWKPGVTLDLGITRDKEATVICSGRAILQGATGRKRNGRMALRVTRELGDGKGEMIDDDLIAD